MKKIISILAIFMVIACMPAEVDAASYIRTLKASAKQTSVTVSWNKLSSKQQKKVSGIAVFRNKKLVKKLNKKASSYTDTGLTKNTRYEYQVKTYSIKKQTRWYNKKTKKWQAKKPAKKIRGKSRKVTVCKYGNASPVKTVRTLTSSKTPTKPTSTSPYFYAPQITAAYACSQDVDNPYASVFWSGGADTDRYRVYRDNKMVKEFDYSGQSYTDHNVDWGETHTYKVSALNRNNKELFSASKTVTIPTKKPYVNQCTVEYANAHGQWVDVGDAYDVLNEWRMDKNNWWYLQDDSENGKVTVSGLYRLERDPQLEKAVKQRAKEQWIQYWVNGKMTHDRAGDTRYHQFVETYASFGCNWHNENLLFEANNLSPRSVICGGPDRTINIGWDERNCTAGGQGHRKNMLATGNHATKVGIACFKVGNMTCWAMAIGY